MELNPKHHEAGFTLVEILCVLALLGLTAGLVVVNLPRGEDPFKSQMQNFASQLNIAAQDSAIDGRIRGIEIHADGYDLMEYSGAWETRVEADWNDVFSVDLKVEDEIIDFKDRAKIIAKSKDIVAAPLITLDPTGGVTDFELEIEGRDTTYNLAPDERGRIVAEIMQ